MTLKELSKKYKISCYTIHTILKQMSLYHNLDMKTFDLRFTLNQKRKWGR